MQLNVLLWVMAQLERLVYSYHTQQTNFPGSMYQRYLSYVNIKTLRLKVLRNSHVLNEMIYYNLNNYQKGIRQLCCNGHDSW